MADTARRILCKTCGQEVDVTDADSYFIGKKKIYECRRCKLKGSSMADGFHSMMCMRMIKER